MMITKRFGISYFRVLWMFGGATRMTIDDEETRTNERKVERERGKEMMCFFGYYFRKSTLA